VNREALPDWICVDSHTSIYPDYRALCLRCQDREVGKLKTCKSWAETHAKECKGAECENCGHVYEGYSWDRCPKCGYCINDVIKCNTCGGGIFYDNKWCCLDGFYKDCHQNDSYKWWPKSTGDTP
jgi:hypothetical protein